MIPRRRHLAGIARRLTSRAAVWRSWLMLRVFLPMRVNRAARLLYAAVLDGHTVNLHASLPPGTRVPEAAGLVLQRGRQRYETTARVYEDHTGRLLMDAAVLLGAEAGGAPVGNGRWKVRLRLRTGRRTSRIPLLLVEPPRPYDGPTMPMSASPLTGQRHRLGRSVTGNLRVVTADARPSAEVVKVDLSHTGLSVDFRVIGAEVAEPWSEFTATGRRVKRPVHPLGDGVWRVVVPLEEMSPQRRATEHWDVALCSDGERRLRLGRRLHDVRNPIRVFAINRTSVAPRGRAPMLVQPRYTPAGNFRVTCSRMPEAGRRT
ncbi:hypothetical protein [Streptomyces peucetius]|uniref:PilZ domain-containing protein n=1 Tax=Streptomyces peucetius TaxID=1950 RepID=A0ABY6IE20_STRPE|nr:hypothetical protein [Streptomyces peucetius]UYQ65121.1 hypothetical protein OGH68_29110 [Streptomyces peucetius]